MGTEGSEKVYSALSQLLRSLITRDQITFEFISVPNRPFYSCVLSYLAMNASEAGGGFALIQTSQLLTTTTSLLNQIIIVNGWPTPQIARKKANRGGASQIQEHTF